MPIKNNGPAQSAMPTTISVNPSATAVIRPNQAIVQKTTRNGRLTANQIPLNTVKNISPHDLELGGCKSWMLESNERSARRRLRGADGSRAHHWPAER